MPASFTPLALQDSFNVSATLSGRVMWGGGEKVDAFNARTHKFLIGPV